MNSRRQKRAVGTWRRRACSACSAVFTTHERPVLSETLRFQNNQGNLEPFWRDNLFLSIHDSCKHRKDALTAAMALTNTVIEATLVSSQASRGLVPRSLLVQETTAVLNRFDSVAATHYVAYHPL